MKHLFILASSIFLLANCSNASKKKEVKEENQKPKIDNLEYIADGQMIAVKTFTALSGNLQKAMKEGGVSNAVKYCNLAATPIVDSLEQAHQVEIKRTSLKLRNPSNEPNPGELEQLNKYQQLHDSDQILKPVVVESAEKVTVHAPIFVMPLCQKCHGTIGKEMMQEDYDTIKELYPLDNATEYNSGDLRGIWSISFRK